MIGRLVAWAKAAWWEFRDDGRTELQEARAGAEAVGCRDSAEELAVFFRGSWGQFGGDNKAHAAVIRYETQLHTVYKDTDASKYLHWFIMGTFHHGHNLGDTAYCRRTKWDARILALCMLGAKYPLDQTISREDVGLLAELFPVLTRKVRLHDKGLPTLRKVLEYVANL